MTHWRRDGGAVVVTVSSDDDALWEALRSRLYGADARGASRSRVLSLVEAYFALAEERLLSTGSQSLETIWRDFQAASASFVSQYVAFHHFRRCGWLLQSGLNYGAQFVLYRGDADVFHSEYIVHIHVPGGTASWHSVQALTRLAEDVKKTVVLCEVTRVDRREETIETSDEIPTTELPVIQTHARYDIHDKTYEIDAVLIRYWDPATVDQDRASYGFSPQPILLKKPKRSKAARKKKQSSKTDG